MKTGLQWKRALLVFAGILTLLMLTPSAFGQCAMCKTALAGSNNALFIKSFNLAVLVLLIPPVTIFCSIFVALKRHREPKE